MPSCVELEVHLFAERSDLHSILVGRVALHEVHNVEPHCLTSQYISACEIKPLSLGLIVGVVVQEQIILCGTLHHDFGQISTLELGVEVDDVSSTRND